MKVMRIRDKEGSDIHVIVNREEAIRIIKSLAHQMMMKSANTGREEFQTEDGEYFTIAVKGKS